MLTTIENWGRYPACVAVISGLLLTACGVSEAPQSEADAAGNEIDPFSTVAQPQLAVEADGTVLLVWRHPRESGSDLYVARRADDGTFSVPVRINDQPGTVSGADLDGLRAAVAVGPEGRLAVAWNEEHGDVRLALGRDHGATFAPSIRLNQDDGPAMQSFVSIAFDAASGLHAVWLDTRVSGTSDEEPADLYHAMVHDGRVVETNLTDDTTPSVCGCCRPHAGRDRDGSVGFAFRNTSTEGFRDIYRVDWSGPPREERRFSAPRPVGPPLWKIDGCPMAGPLVVGAETLWIDASAGHRRTLLAGPRHDAPIVLLQGDGEQRIDLPPRRVAGDDPERPLVLIPGRPAGRLFQRGEDGAWRESTVELPAWTTSAALLNGRLLVAGTESGELKIDTRRFAGQAPGNGTGG